MYFGQKPEEHGFSITKGLGPSPGWGPVRVGAHMGPYMGPYGPLWAHILAHMALWAHMGLPGQVLEKASTFRKTIWTNFARFGSKNSILTKFINDSASFLLEKLKNQVILIKNLNI